MAMVNTERSRIRSSVPNNAIGSMGGIIVRETMYQMQEHAGRSPFPDTIGYVTQAITFSSPHGGVSTLDNLGCLGCTQGKELSHKSDFISELSTYGQNPQTSGGTDWTVIGSECDNVVGGAANPSNDANAVNMNAGYAVVYADDKRSKSTTTCYDHGGALHDSSTSQDAQYYYCSASNPDEKSCGIDYQDKHLEGDNWQKTDNGLRGLSLLYSVIRGCMGRNTIDVSTSLKSDFLPLCTESPALPNGAERAGRSPRLWLLSTAITAWTLLRR
jgi:triacylglycerol esterase/lipase EstA (alpha/beta hydrolase family)